MVHYPHYAAGMALTGDYDVVCCGHDHRVSVQEVNNTKGGVTWLVNPGTVGGVGKPPSYVLADLESLKFSVYDVPTAPGEACNTPPVSVHI
jgi:predicted phosphodiesterase